MSRFPTNLDPLQRLSQSGRRIGVATPSVPAGSGSVIGRQLAGLLAGATDLAGVILQGAAQERRDAEHGQASAEHSAYRIAEAQLDSAVESYLSTGEMPAWDGLGETDRRVIEARFASRVQLHSDRESARRQSEALESQVIRAQLGLPIDLDGLDDPNDRLTLAATAATARLPEATAQLDAMFRQAQESGKPATYTELVPRLLESLPRTGDAAIDEVYMAAWSRGLTQHAQAREYAVLAEADRRNAERARAAAIFGERMRLDDFAVTFDPAAEGAGASVAQFLDDAGARMRAANPDLDPVTIKALLVQPFVARAIRDADPRILDAVSAWKLAPKTEILDVRARIEESLEKAAEADALKRKTTAMDALEELLGQAGAVSGVRSSGAPAEELPPTTTPQGQLAASIGVMQARMAASRADALLSAGTIDESDHAEILAKASGVERGIQERQTRERLALDVYQGRAAGVAVPWDVIQEDVGRYFAQDLAAAGSADERLAVFATAARRLPRLPAAQEAEIEGGFLSNDPAVFEGAAARLETLRTVNPAAYNAIVGQNAPLGQKARMLVAYRKFMTPRSDDAGLLALTRLTPDDLAVVRESASSEVAQEVARKVLDGWFTREPQILSGDESRLYEAVFAAEYGRLNAATERPEEAAVLAARKAASAIDAGFVNLRIGPSGTLGSPSAKYSVPVEVLLFDGQLEMDAKRSPVAEALQSDELGRLLHALQTPGDFFSETEVPELLAATAGMGRDRWWERPSEPRIPVQLNFSSVDPDGWNAADGTIGVQRVIGGRRVTLARIPLPRGRDGYAEVLAEYERMTRDLWEATSAEWSARRGGSDAGD